MDFGRLRACLDSDYLLLRAAVAAADPGTAVPSCPGWTVSDLADHVATVYLHKTECIRLNAFPDPWPPTGRNPDPVEALDETYAPLIAQFDAHSTGDTAATWHDPDQTVGFWVRRMAQETVIHRIDAELAAGLPVAPIPDDLALDGVDEVLTLFLGYLTTKWPEDFETLLDAPDDRIMLVSAGSRSWTAQATSAGVVVADAPAGIDAAASISGEPVAVLRRLWNRSIAGDKTTATGDAPLLARFQSLLVAATQ
jgi:uncharacterized protein (TIGR03083 family)